MIDRTVTSDGVDSARNIFHPKLRKPLHECTDIELAQRLLACEVRARNTLMQPGQFIDDTIDYGISAICEGRRTEASVHP